MLIYCMKCNFRSAITQNSFDSFPTLEQYFLEKCSCRTRSVPSEPSSHLFFIVQLWVAFAISYQWNVIDIHCLHLEKCELFLLFVPNTVYHMKLSFLLHHWFCNRNYELSLTLSYFTWPFLLQIANYWTLSTIYDSCMLPISHIKLWGNRLPVVCSCLY